MEVKLKKTKMGKIWNLLQELECVIPFTGQVTIELHVKEFAMKDAYVTTREKIKD
jgi:hypothetical protein